MSKPWIKSFLETRTDQKILKLTPAERWVWQCLLWLAEECGGTGHVFLVKGQEYTSKDLAEACKVPRKVAETAVGKLGKMEIVQRVSPNSRRGFRGALYIKNYRKRQDIYPSWSKQIRKEQKQKERVASVSQESSDHVARESRGRVDKDKEVDKSRGRVEVEYNKPDPTSSADTNNTNKFDLSENDICHEIKRLYEYAFQRKLDDREQARARELSKDLAGKCTQKMLNDAFKEAAVNAGPEHDTMNLKYVGAILREWCGIGRGPPR